MYDTSVSCMLTTAACTSFVSDDPEILALADTYARYSALSVWPTCAYCALRQYLQAQEIVNPATIVAGSSVGVSVLANYVLIYGFAGYGALGFIGCKLTTVLDRG